MPGGSSGQSMTINIQTLEGVPTAEIIQVFNRSFGDYRIKMRLNQELLQHKMQVEQIHLSFSAGVFVQDKLAGLMLHAIDAVGDEIWAYNGGTGVVPEWRGQGFSTRMYEYLFGLFRDNNISQCLLEVMETNESALHVYRKLGFELRRELDCLQGVVHFPKLPSLAPGLELIPVSPDAWDTFAACWDFQPTWQNTTRVIARAYPDFSAIGLYHEGTLAGYILSNPETGRIAQFGVHPRYRNKGYGTLLFAYLSKLTSPRLSVINVDKGDLATMAFLQKLGFRSYVAQLEMRKIM